jgi:hypothetical protein
MDIYDDPFSELLPLSAEPTSIDTDSTPAEGVATFPDDCLPPESKYRSREELFTSINQWAAPRGYAFVTGRSNKAKTKQAPTTVTYTCDRLAVLQDHQTNANERQTHGEPAVDSLS